MHLVTMQEAEAHLRIDSDAETSWLKVFIPAVSDAVAAWLKDSWRLYVLSGAEDSHGVLIPATDDYGKPIIRPVVKAAVLLELAQQYRFRDGSDAPRVAAHEGHGYVLGAGATALLAPLRRSTVA